MRPARSARFWEASRTLATVERGRLGAKARRAGAVRGPRAPLRPARRAAQLRAGSALAPGDGRRRSRPARPSGCSTSRPAPGLVARRAGPPLRMLGGRARPERRDARRGAASGSPREPRARASDRARRRARPSACRFADGEFDHLTFTYLLRYVDDPAATLARARPRGQAGRPGRLARVRPARAAALAAALAALHPGRPAGRSAGSFGRDWYEVGRFLGPSIEELLSSAGRWSASSSSGRRAGISRRARSGG